MRPNSVSARRKRHDLRMTRWWDADKALARGAAPGTRPGRAIRFQSRPASRDMSTERPPRLDPPRGALAVFRPRLSLLRPGQWIAVTAGELEARDRTRIWTLRRSDVQAIHVEGRIVFVGRGDRALAGVPPVYSRSQIDAHAAVLGVRVTAR
jgi:hypothetical protein